jgi:hypothetical protein
MASSGSARRRTRVCGGRCRWRAFRFSPMLLGQGRCSRVCVSCTEMGRRPLQTRTPDTLRIFNRKRCATPAGCIKTALGFPDSLFRSSCGFLLVAILARINKSYGLEIGDEVIGTVGQRIRGLMRSKDTLGRYLDDTFGLVLTDCTPDDMATAAERVLAGVRDELVPTGAGPGCGDRDDRRRDGASLCPHSRDLAPLSHKVLGERFPCDGS